MPEKTELIKEVKNLLSKGLTQKLIAEKLGVSRSTITRIMPKVKEDSSEKYLQIVKVDNIVLGHSPIIHLSTESFKTMLDEDLPLIHTNNNDIYQIQNNYTLQFKIQTEWSNSQNIIFYDFNRWLNLIFETDINNEQQVNGDCKEYTHILLATGGQLKTKSIIML
jgi:transcriptional regulator with XRE-family HTH domain